MEADDGHITGCHCVRMWKTTYRNLKGAEPLAQDEQRIVLNEICQDCAPYLIDTRWV